MNVYWNEYNIRMGATRYVPLVSGLLQAHAQAQPDLADYTFMPFLAAMDTPAKILAQYTEPPDVACFSSLMWNEQLNDTVAREVKRRWPDCLIVYGGPHVPMPPQHRIADWMDAHPWVDVAVRAEGEDAMVDILRAHRDGTGYAHIPGVASWVKGQVVFNDTARPFVRDLDTPSPYLTGMYDQLMADGRAEGLDFQAILETNRGCPFPCTFCYWGRGGLSRNYRYKPMATVLAEIDWMGAHGIRYVFNADSNFGMHPRDAEIADAIIATKAKYGYPEKFRTCFGKNTDARILAIGTKLHAAGLEKGITLARQSNDPQTLVNIRRTNIKMATYENLQQQFTARQVPVYSEMILGLPGETKESWKQGLEDLLSVGVKHQVFLYLCQVLPNTEMAEPAYLAKHGMQLKRIALAEIHGEVRPPDFVTEYEDIVIGTATMPHEDWKASLRLSYVLMLLHSLKLAYFVLVLLKDRYGIAMTDLMAFIAERQFTSPAPLIRLELDMFDVIIDRMVNEGAHRGTVLPGYGNLYWDVEEAAFLRITQQTDAFYDELYHIVLDCCGPRSGITDECLQEVLRYQELRIPSQEHLSMQDFRCDWNVHDFFEARFTQSPMLLRRESSWMTVTPRKWDGDRERFARETILWGRKSGTLLTPCVTLCASESVHVS